MGVQEILESRYYRKVCGFASKDMVGAQWLRRSVGAPNSLQAVHARLARQKLTASGGAL